MRRDNLRKLLKIASICIIILVLVLIMSKTQFLEKVISVLFGKTENHENVFQDKWYFNELLPREQEIYLKIATVVDNLEKTVVEVGNELLSANNASRAFEAYLLDNPSVFYISNQYNISESRIFGVTKIEIKLEYVGNKNDIANRAQALSEKVNSILQETINVNMTDYEKEVALHDYLVQNVSYYEYADMDEIPKEKHTAYGALVGKSAVCDGISKAYSLLLYECGITSTVVTGKVDTKHAWNKIMLDGEWYNVDTTSDACGEDRVLSHIYFNLTDEEIIKTHTFETTFDTPECINTKYNYYEYNNFKLTKKDFFTDKIRKIVSASKNESLEFEVDETIDIKTVVRELYNIDFNNFKTNKVSEIKYYHVRNILVVAK